MTYMGDKFDCTKRGELWWVMEQECLDSKY